MPDFWHVLWQQALAVAVGALGAALVFVWRLYLLRGTLEANIATVRSEAVMGMAALRIVAENLDKKVTNEVKDRIQGETRIMDFIEREFRENRLLADDRHTENRNRLGTIEGDVKLLLSRNPAPPWRPMT